MLRLERKSDRVRTFRAATFHMCERKQIGGPIEEIVGGRAPARACHMDPAVGSSVGELMAASPIVSLVFISLLE